MHLCDATRAQLADASRSAGPFCYLRGFFDLLGIRMETPGAAFQLIVPVMLVFISVRLFGNGVAHMLTLIQSPVAVREISSDANGGPPNPSSN